MCTRRLRATPQLLPKTTKRHPHRPLPSPVRKPKNSRLPVRQFKERWAPTVAKRGAPSVRCAGWVRSSTKGGWVNRPASRGEKGVMSTVFPGESTEYRAARERLLEQEIELRRVMEAVAAARRNLPRGGVIPEDYVFGETGTDGVPVDVRL